MFVLRRVFVSIFGTLICMQGLSATVFAQPETAGGAAVDDALAVPTLPKIVVQPEPGVATPTDPTDSTGNLLSTPSLTDDRATGGVSYPGPRGSSSALDQYFSGSVSWSSNAIQRDSDRVGPYGQPVWTTQRPFATSRAYVLPPGQAQVEQWVRPTYPRGDKPEYRMLEEFAIGLPGRFQLDIYERWNIEPNAANHEVANHEGVMLELRWAVADWGVIPLNPTMYIEWVERGGPQDKTDKYEAKLLLADELLPNLFYSSNLILEQEVADARENELGWSNAISVPLVDRILMGGVECVWSGVNEQGARDTRTNEFLIGPSFQLRPTNRTFLNTVGLFGTTPDAPEAQLYFIFGYQFGVRSGPSSRYISGPASTRGE